MARRSRPQTRTRGNSLTEKAKSQPYSQMAHFWSNHCKENFKGANVRYSMAEDIGPNCGSMEASRDTKTR